MLMLGKARKFLWIISGENFIELLFLFFKKIHLNSIAYNEDNSI